VPTTEKTLTRHMTRVQSQRLWPLRLQVLPMHSVPVRGIIELPVRRAISGALQGLVSTHRAASKPTATTSTLAPQPCYGAASQRITAPTTQPTTPSPKLPTDASMAAMMPPCITGCI
jgi:hypothetical protein